MVIKNNGNVGIGTTSPKGKLAIQNTNSLTNISTELDKFSLYFDSNNTAKRNGMAWSYYSSYGAHVGITCSSFNADALELWGTNGRRINLCTPSNNDTAPWDHPGLTVWQNKVGIGTTTPSQALDVIGSIKSSLFLILNNGYSLYWGDSKSKIAGFGGTTGNIQFNTNSNERMRIDSAGNVGIGTTDPAYQFEVTSSGTSALFNASTAYVMGWNRSDITNGMWWWHVEGSYSTLHRNGYGHCARFYRTTNSSCCVFGDPGIANAYTEYHTNYSSWDGKLLVGAGPMGNDSGQNNWVANYACVFATTTNLHLESGAGATMYLNYYTDGNVWIDGSVRYTSDDRLKHNEKEVVNALDVINKLDVLTYFKSKKKYAENHHYELDQSGNPITDDSYYIETGLIAQRVKEIPELEYCVSYTDPIYEDDDYGDYAVNYRDIFCYNVAATQELDRKVTALETVGNLDHNVKILDLESKIETLTKENQDQNVKILDLYKENEALKARLAKIEAFLGI
jgi:hypothetical protein